MKKLALLLLLFSCEKENVVKCYTCNQRVTVNSRSTFRTFRDCGTSKELVERVNSSPWDNRGNELYTKCYEEK